MRKVKSSWHSMDSAPKDGTVILIVECPNGEDSSWGVMQAAYMEMHGNPLCIGWWGVWVSRYSSEGTTGLPCNWKSLVTRPICWMPLPDMEPLAKLKRRYKKYWDEKENA